MKSEDFRANAKSRAVAARLLASNGQADEAAESVAFALEFRLKALIMERHGLAKWPQSKQDFQKLGLPNLKNHDLNLLLAQSGKETLIKTTRMVEWSNCIRWSPDARYQPVGTVTKSYADGLVKDVFVLLDDL